MTQWFRFTTASGTVYGEVAVPSTPPPWFAPRLKAINDAHSRTIDMSDFSAAEWLDTLSSENRPIPLRKPLSPQPQDELLFFAEGKLQEMKEAIAALSKGVEAKDGQPGQPGIPPAAILRDDQFVRKYAVFMEDFENIHEDQRKNYRPMPRNQVQEGKGRTFVNYVPLMDPDAQDEDVESYVLYPHNVLSRVDVRPDAKFTRMVEKIYGGVRAESAASLPRILPRA